MKVTHIITGLNTGGAERMLHKLVSKMERPRFELEVISLTEIGELAPAIQSLGIPVRALGMRRGAPDLRAVRKLTRWLRESKPDVIQTWMYHADLIGGLAARNAGIRALAWNIRNNDLDPKTSRRSTIWTVKLCARLSKRLPRRIVSCAQVAQKTHIALGYAAQKFVVIPNGFDLAAFRPNPAMRGSVREELGLPETAPLIGMAGRFDPQKDYHNFMAAAGSLHAALPDAHFLLCGAEVEDGNATLDSWRETFGLEARCHLLGRRDDMPRLMAALDVATLSSAYGEGFPNVIGEAMACAVPCVVTDVGDSGYLVGTTGRTVVPRDPQALASAWQDLLSMSKEARQQLGQEARCRVEQNFALPMVVARYQALYEEMASECAV